MGPILFSRIFWSRSSGGVSNWTYENTPSTLHVCHDHYHQTRTSLFIPRSAKVFFLFNFVILLFLSKDSNCFNRLCLLFYYLKYTVRTCLVWKLTCNTCTATFCWGHTLSFRHFPPARAPTRALSGAGSSVAIYTPWSLDSRLQWWLEPFKNFVITVTWWWLVLVRIGLAWR